MEDAQHAEIAHAWISSMLSDAPKSRNQLFKRFADFVTQRNLVTRCRIFRITETSKQIGLYQSGVNPAKNFVGFPLGPSCGDFLATLQRDKKLLLLRRNSVNGDIQGDDLIIEVVTRVQHEEKFLKQQTNEWLEIPVLVDEKVSAKAVVDHHGRRFSNFTKSEIKILAMLMRLLSSAVEAISNQELTSLLCRAGAIESLLRHQLFGCLDPVRRHKGRNLRKALDASLRYVQGLDTLFSTNGSARITTLKEEIEAAQQLIMPRLGKVDFRAAPSIPAARLRGSNYALCLILLVLLENAIAASRKMERGPRIVSLSVSKASANPETRIRVINEGIGVPDKVIRAFAGPPKAPRRPTSRGRGLTYARALAHELGWRLELFRSASPTVFDLVVNT